MNNHRPDCSGCPRCSKTARRILHMKPAEYARYLSAQSRAVMLRNASHHMENNDMSLIKKLNASLRAEAKARTLDGQRNSASDQEHLDAAHDAIVNAAGQNPTVPLMSAHEHLVAAGASCDDDCAMAVPDPDTDQDEAKNLSAYAPVDPYRDAITKMRGAASSVTVMSAAERASLGGYADDVARRRLSEIR
jgi:hypothetical protein